MSVSYKYWDDCVDPEDMQLMWTDVAVSKEWIDAGERMGQKVHISRDPDGELYLTQTEMRCVAGITVQRHFNSQIDPDMICAIAEIASDRQLLTENYDRKTKQTRIGIMQVAPEIAEWLSREMGYRNYGIEGNPTLLFKPYVNVYFGAAYIKWLSSCDGKERNEEFVIRAYKGGKKKAGHKSTAAHFQRYLSEDGTLTRTARFIAEVDIKKEEEIADANSSAPNALNARIPTSLEAGQEWTYWDKRVSPGHMEEMWSHSDVLKEWSKSGERRGKVRFSHDSQKRPYLSRIEVKAVAEIIISQHFNSKQIKPTGVAALAEVCSMRFVNGVRSRTGLMGIDYPTALWLYRDVGYRAYTVTSVEDLYNPFVSMYFGVAYLAWLSEYEGRERHHEFVVQAYLGGPENVNIQETGPLWNKFQEALRYYDDPKKDQGSCCIL